MINSNEAVLVLSGLHKLGSVYAILLIRTQHLVTATTTVKTMRLEPTYMFSNRSACGTV